MYPFALSYSSVHFKAAWCYAHLKFSNISFTMPVSLILKGTYKLRSTEHSPIRNDACDRAALILIITSQRTLTRELFLRARCICSNEASALQCRNCPLHCNSPAFILSSMITIRVLKQRTWAFKISIPYFMHKSEAIDHIFNRSGIRDAF